MDSDNMFYQCIREAKKAGDEDDDDDDGVQTETGWCHASPLVDPDMFLNLWTIPFMDNLPLDPPLLPLLYPLSLLK